METPAPPEDRIRVRLEMDEVAGHGERGRPELVDVLRRHVRSMKAHLGYPWPIGWLCLSPAWRLRDDDVGDVSLEFLEGCHIRPVKR